MRAENIQLLKHIGDGHSSRVHLANYFFGEGQVRQVAVKTVTNATFELEDVMREIDLISRCRHPNIVEYIGHFQNARGSHIVTEYMSGGDLHEFLINGDNKPTIGDAFIFVEDICAGMHYLTKEMHLIHRDLAARNCMLDGLRQAVKITDFGLCRRSNVDYEYISENREQQLPFRWTALECFGSNSKFSSRSDVWSFAVVVWEIFARNLQPYESLDSKGVREFLQAGRRLQQIPFLPDELYQLMLRCWDAVPERRPTFAELHAEIQAIRRCVENSSPEYMSTEYETPISSRGSRMEEVPRAEDVPSTSAVAAAANGLIESPL